jgi:nucleotide-binding universal stress UspA family protein
MMNESGADILVVGAHGSGSTPGFLHLGSVVEHLAHHSTLPMAVIPEQSRPVFDTIALGVDGSSNNQAAIDLAADLAAGIGATVLAIAVEEPVVEFSPANSPQNWRRYTEEQVRTTWAKRVEDAGVELEVAAVRDLRPAEGLLRTAKQQRCDVLVVGLRGLGGISGLRAGGVAMQVLHHADRPIVLVPPR